MLIKIIEYWFAWRCICRKALLSKPTRTTIMPVFWGYSPAPSWLPILLSHIGCQVRRRQSQSYKSKNSPKFHFFLILKLTLHETHLLRLLDKICKYEMDPISIIEDTDRTWFCPQTDRRTDGRTDQRTDGQMDKVKPVYPPFNFVEVGASVYTTHYSNGISVIKKPSVRGSLLYTTHYSHGISVIKKNIFKVYFRHRSTTSYATVCLASWQEIKLAHFFPSV